MTAFSRQQIDDQELVARYLADQLSDSERNAFEAYFLEHPELVSELNRTAQFKSGLIDLQRSGALKDLLRRAPWWRSPRTLALAASLIVLIVAGGIFLQQRPRPEPLLALATDAFAGALPGSAVTLERTRSTSYDATLEVPRSPTSIELRLKPDTTGRSSSYKIAIGAIGIDDSVSWLSEIPTAQPTADGFVRVFLDTSKLSPAIYEIRMTEIGGANAPTSFLIEAIPASR